jgi:hypothetical protein
MLHASFAWYGATVHYKRDFVSFGPSHLLDANLEEGGRKEKEKEDDCVTRSFVRHGTTVHCKRVFLPLEPRHLVIGIWCLLKMPKISIDQYIYDIIRSQIF